jgi:lipid II isoglutaminyl synthase (glutamine-hydrolysing)
VSVVHGGGQRVAPAGHALDRRLRAITALARLAERTSVRTGLGAGGVIGGRVILRLAPDAVRELSSEREVVLVSGTNGKTTTSSYLAACLRGRSAVDTNTDGANTPAGIARTLSAGRAPTVVLETDEGWLPWALSQTRASTAVLLNLSRDQLHRHHEVAALSTTWHEALPQLHHAIANCDDPHVVFPATAARRRTWVSAGHGWLDDAVVCPRCGDECRRTADDWRCGCGLARPRPDWWLEDQDLVGAETRVSLDLGLPGAVNLANAAMAVAAAASLGVDPVDAAGALHDIVSVAGRYDVVEHEGREARLVLAKNPASWAEALALVAPGDRPIVLAFNADGVDGRDPSWLYDVPFAHIAAHPVVVIGRRATDMVVRLEMADVPDVREAEDVRAALELVRPGPVDVVANYTAFQEIRRELGHET